MHDTNYTIYLILDTGTIFVYVTVKIVGRGSCHPSTHLPRSHRTCGSATFPPGNPNMTFLTEIKYKPSYPFRVPIIICKQVGKQRESRGQHPGCTSGLLRRIATNMHNIYIYVYRYIHYIKYIHVCDNASVSFFIFKIQSQWPHQSAGRPEVNSGTFQIIQSMIHDWLYCWYT